VDHEKEHFGLLEAGAQEINRDSQTKCIEGGESGVKPSSLGPPRYFLYEPVRSWKDVSPWLGLSARRPKNQTQSSEPLIALPGGASHQGWRPVSNSIKTNTNDAAAKDI
jgi:hypothetical protein